MIEWLTAITTITVTGSTVCLISLLLTYVLKDSLSAKWSYWNRKIAAFFFLVPVWLIPQFFLSFKNSETYSIPTRSLVQDTPFELSITTVQFLFVIWCVGAIFASVKAFISYRTFKKIIKNTVVPISKNHLVWETLRLNAKQLKLKNDINIVYSQYHISPVLIGLVKPTIILPAYEMPIEDLELIIKHELNHLQKKDLWVRIAVLLAGIIHWFNPVVYQLRKEIHFWSELSCDADVVKDMSHNERKRYGEMILNMIERANNKDKDFTLGVFFSDAQINLKRRLIKMLKVKRMSKSLVRLSAVTFLGLLSLGVGGTFITQKYMPVVSANNHAEGFVNALQISPEIRLDGEVEAIEEGDQSTINEIVKPANAQDIIVDQRPSSTVEEAYWYINKKGEEVQVVKLKVSQKEKGKSYNIYSNSKTNDKVIEESR
ncbi:M56 family metallopeptidase [Sporosarcina sp. CAU 1771]